MVLERLNEKAAEDLGSVTQGAVHITQILSGLLENWASITLVDSTFSAVTPEAVFRALLRATHRTLTHAAGNTPRWVASSHTIAHCRKITAEETEKTKQYMTTALRAFSQS
jgi:hypothetical protein